MASKIRKRNKHLNKENANKMSKTKFIKNNRDKFIYGIIIFLSILFIASIVYYGKNIPVGDDYQAVLKFGVDYKNSTTFSQKIGLIFEQHNEHRIVFVRLATLASIRLFGEVNFKFMLLLGGISILAILFILFQLFEIEKEKLLLFIPAALLL